MNHWRALGLERTGDVSEIRRAYARKLKATDVEADPAAFIALRAALERATAEAARMAWQAKDAAPRAELAAVGEDETISASFGAAAQGEESPPTQPIEADLPAEQAALLAQDESPTEQGPEPAPPARPEPADNPNARFDALNTLLFSEDALSPDPAALSHALRDIIHHPEMDRVDHAAQVEPWLAESLYHSIPRSDAIIPMAVAHFGWAREPDAARQRPFIAAVARRAEDLACIERLRNPKHRWHDAFEQLSRPAEKPIGLAERLRFKPEIAQLLVSLRLHFPAVEQSLNADQVQRWDREIGRKRYVDSGRSARISWYGWLAISWLLLNVATISTRVFY